MDTPRIYVASLSDYNAGTLHGRWIDAVDVDDIREQVAEMLEESPERNICQWCGNRFHVIDEGRFAGWVVHDYTPDSRRCRYPFAPIGGNAEEWAIHDYEGFGDIHISEWETFERVAAIGAGIEEHGAPFAAFVANDNDPDTEQFEDAYHGEWSSIGEYAEEFAEDIGAVNTRDGSWPWSHIDWERAGRDLEMGGDIWTADAPGGVYVFRSI